MNTGVPDLSVRYPKVYEAYKSIGWVSERATRNSFQEWMQRMKVPYLDYRTPLEAIDDGDEEKVIDGLMALAEGAYL